MGHGLPLLCRIIALRNEKGSYNSNASRLNAMSIIALRNEKGVITIQYKFII